MDLNEDGGKGDWSIPRGDFLGESISKGQNDIWSSKIPPALE
jgi:hypothetical protein